MLKFTAAIAATSAAAVLAVSVIGTSHAATFNIAPVAVDSVVQKTGTRLSGSERLRRLMRPHFKIHNPITQSVRDATGNPNISVIDNRRGDAYQTYRCHFFNLSKNKRVLKCD